MGGVAKGLEKKRLRNSDSAFLFRSRRPAKLLAFFLTFFDAFASWGSNEGP
jgi:hypothetical protein